METFLLYGVAIAVLFLCMWSAYFRKRGDKQQRQIDDLKRELEEVKGKMKE